MTAVHTFNKRNILDQIYGLGFTKFEISDEKIIVIFPEGSETLTQLSPNEASLVQRSL